MVLRLEHAEAGNLRFMAIFASWWALRVASQPIKVNSALLGRFIVLFFASPCGRDDQKRNNQNDSQRQAY